MNTAKDLKPFCKKPVKGPTALDTALSAPSFADGWLYASDGHHYATIKSSSGTHRDNWPHSILGVQRSMRGLVLTLDRDDMACLRAHLKHAVSANRGGTALCEINATHDRVFFNVLLRTSLLDYDKNTPAISTAEFSIPTTDQGGFAFTVSAELLEHCAVFMLAAKCSFAVHLNKQLVKFESASAECGIALIKEQHART